MSAGETSALCQAGLYALLMLLLVFVTVALWEVVSLFPLLGLPMGHYFFKEEWDEYNKQKGIRKKTKE